MAFDLETNENAAALPRREMMARMEKIFIVACLLIIIFDGEGIDEKAMENNEDEGLGFEIHLRDRTLYFVRQDLLI